MIKNLLGLTFIFLAFALNAQRYSVLSYNTAEGLPQSQVTSITQDKNGYLWVGTLGGLARFNGKEFHSYTTEEGILNNRVTFLTFIDGVLFVGHEGGVSSIDKNKIKKWSFSGPNAASRVTDILKFNDRIIVSSNGGGLYELKESKLAPVKINHDAKINLKGTSLLLHREDEMRMRDLLSYKNELWIATGGGVIKTKDLKSFDHIYNLANFSVSGMSVKKDKVFVTTFNNGLIEYSSSNGNAKVMRDLDSMISLRGCIVDSKDNLWVNSSVGVYRLKNGKIDLYLNQMNGLPMESIRAIFEDNQGNIWLGSEGKGLLRFPSENFVYYSENEGLSSDLILNVNQDEAGHYWIGTFDQGLIYSPYKNTFVTIPLENSGTIWSSIIGVDGMNWFGTGSGLVSMKGTIPQRVYYTEDGLPGDKITALLKLTSSSFYLGGSDGVGLYKNGKFSLLKMDEPATVRDFCKVGEKIYCATDIGLFEIHENSLKNVQGFTKTCYSLIKDGDQNLWIGTEEGLYKYENGIITQVSFSKMASSNFINFLNYSDGKVYAGTNNGLFVFSYVNGKMKVVNYGIGEGVVNLETNLNSSYFDRKGRLWFGTASGLVTILPAESTEKFSEPKILLKNLLINFQNIDLHKYAKEFDQNGLPIDLKLPYTKNNITFELDGIALANYPGMKFQYWLEGQDDTWSPLNSNTTITFSGLSAGNYTFHARCIDSRGNISKEISFNFTVKQAFYKSWWFIALAAGILAFIVFRYFKFRLKREREQNEKEKLEYKSRLLTLEQKSLNASMNRHFIFNSLNSIQYFINTQDRLSANRFLTNFAKLIRKNLDSSDDGSLVPLSQELERLELYMSLESMRFKDRFDYSIVVDPNVDTESIIIPAMMLQPFIENSIIHGILPDESKKGQIFVHVSLEKDILTIDLIDNGVGIDTSIESKSNYDGDHRSQGMEITTKRIELLQKLSNRSFELIGPRQINNPDGSINGTRVTLKFQVENLD